MSEQTSLVSAWDTSAGGQRTLPPVEFFRLKDGEQASVRVVGSGVPKSIFKHKFFIQGKTYYATCPGKNDNCPACKAGNKLLHSNAVTVLDRRDGRVKIWEFSNTMKRDIGAFVESKDYGDPRHYDLVVTRRGTGLTDTRYTVFPGVNRAPLSEAEKALLVPDLDEYYRPNLDRLTSLVKGEVPKRKEDTEAVKPLPLPANPLAGDTVSPV